jgi:hypothetical protein
MGYGKLRKALKRGMGGSRCGKGRSKKTETMKDYSDKLRRQESKQEIREQLEEDGLDQYIELE